jgi:hypothetical protein
VDAGVAVMNEDPPVGDGRALTEDPVTVDHQPGCVWAVTASDEAGGGELVVLVLGVAAEAPSRFMCLTLLNTTQIRAPTVAEGTTHDWPLSVEKWKRIA